MNEHGAPEIVAHRWERVWQSMAEHELAGILVYGWGAVGSYGVLAYLTGRVPGPKGEIVVMRVDEPPTIVLGSASECRAAAGVPGPVVTATREGEDHLDAALRLIDASAAERIGLVSGNHLGFPSHYLQRLTERTSPGLVEFTATYDEVRQHQTASDVASMAATIRIAEKSLENLRLNMSVGMTERDGAALLWDPVIKAGGSLPLIFVSCNDYFGQGPGTRTLERGDIVSATVEFAAPDGTWVELGALFAAGQLSADRQAIAHDMVNMQRMAEATLRSGERLSSSARAIHRHIEDRSWRVVEGLGHGVGVDENRRRIAEADPGVLRKGELLAVHPSLTVGLGSPSVGSANVVVVSDDGGMPLSTYPHSVHPLAQVS